MKSKRKRLPAILAMATFGIMSGPLAVFAAEAEEAAQPAVYATFWALVPPIVAIALALITKRSLQLSVCRNFSRSPVLFRLQL